MADVSIKIDPVSLCGRLRKMQSEMTEENRHDEAFLTELAISMITNLMTGGPLEYGAPHYGGIEVVDIDTL